MSAGLQHSLALTGNSLTSQVLTIVGSRMIYTLDQIDNQPVATFVKRSLYNATYKLIIFFGQGFLLFYMCSVPQRSSRSVLTYSAPICLSIYLYILEGGLLYARD